MIAKESNMPSYVLKTKTMKMITVKYSWILSLLTFCTIMFFPNIYIISVELIISLVFIYIIFFYKKETGVQ